MAKQVLGRNLGTLLNGGARDKGKAQAAAPETARPGPGVRSLMRGQPTTAGPLEATSTQRPALPGWYLFGGDILLTAVAVVVACKSPHPLTWGRELFCATTVVLGGCLAAAAVLLAEDRDDSSGAGAGIMADGKAPEKF